MYGGNFKNHFSEWPTLLYAAYTDTTTFFTYMLLKHQLGNLPNIYKTVFRKSMSRSFAAMKPFCIKTKSTTLN